LHAIKASTANEVITIRISSSPAFLQQSCVASQRAKLNPG
jgi:hypothetical protein